jgi:hypothetical protein
MAWSVSTWVQTTIMTGLPTGCLRLGGPWPSSRKYKLDPMSLLKSDIMPPRFIRELIPRRETRAPLGAVVVSLKSVTWVQWAQFWSGSVPYLYRASRYHLYHITIAGLLGRVMPLISSLYRSRYRSCLNNLEGQRVRSYALSFPFLCFLRR